MAVGQNFLAQLKQVRVNKKTITRSIRDLMTDFQSAKIVIPPYQRTFVWDFSKQCRFVESIFMDIPIPPLFFLEKFDEETDATMFEIIDGVQRLTTLANFINGSLKVANLDNLPELNQSTFNHLPSNISALFLERQINTIVIESDTHPEIQFEVFGRLNMGSVSLNAQELRNCMFHGDFNDFLIDCSKNLIYRELLHPFPKLRPPKEGKPDKNRMLDVELVLRFFALHDFYDSETNKYPEPRTETLNDYMREQAKNEDENFKKQKQDELNILFNKVLDMVKITFEDNHYRSFSVKKDNNAKFSPQPNAAIYDIQMLGFVPYNIEDIRDKTEVIYDKFLDLSSFDRNFIDAVSRSTNARLNERIGIWDNQLKQIIENFDSYLQIFTNKKNAYQASPFCSVSGKRIETFEEVDFYDNKIYHKAFSPKLEMSVDVSKKVTINSSVSILLNGNELQFDDIREATRFVIDFISKRITDDIHDIIRLNKLDYVGTQEDLLSREGNKIIQPFGNLNNIDGERLYFYLSNRRAENITRLIELASLFSFMSDFQVLN
ncbi:MAG: DUF262 domain-containing protein [Cyanobacterium sp. T60_A2020_053]|nr:DUF262 domain-containing protein [Cyanobacterium sp. T60_A2020_053]